MKIKMMTLAAFFCCAISSTMFTACGSDDDDDDNNNNKVQVDLKKPAGGQMEYGLYVDEGMLSSFDLTVEYYDENCQLQTEKLTQENWKKTVIVKLPASLEYRLRAKAKDGIDPDSFIRSCGYGYSYMARIVNAAGEVINVKEVKGYAGHGARFGFYKKDFEYLLKQEDDAIVSIHVDFGENGAVGEKDWWLSYPDLNIK